MISVKEIHSYLQNHTINDACKHFNCSFKELFDYTCVYELPEGKYDMRYIYKRNGFYYILKSIDGEYKYFKGSTSLKEAVEFRDKLIENNWRDNGELKIEELKDNRYIYSVGNSFQLKKYINGKTKHFGSFKTLDEAIKARNELIKNNWRTLE